MRPITGSAGPTIYCPYLVFIASSYTCAAFAVSSLRLLTTIQLFLFIEHSTENRIKKAHSFERAFLFKDFLSAILLITRSYFVTMCNMISKSKPIYTKCFWSIGTTVMTDLYLISIITAIWESGC